jgi:hypothetical protein
LPLAENALCAVALITVAARILVASVLGSANVVDELADVGLDALGLDQGTTLVTDGFGAPQAAIFVLAGGGVGEVGAVVTAAAGRLEVDSVPGAVVDGVVDASIFGPVEARTDHAEVAGVDDAASVSTAGTQVGAVQAELLKADCGIRGGDPVASGGAVDGAESFGVVDGAHVVTAAIQTGVPGTFGVSIADRFSEVLGFASLVLAESVGRVVDTLLRGSNAGGFAARKGARVSDAGTLRSGVEGGLAASEDTEGVDQAVGASVARAELGGVEGETVEVGAATVVGASCNGLGIPLAASALVASVGLIDLRTVFGSDAELGTDEGGGVADTIEDLVVNVGEVRVSVVFVGGRGHEAHQPLLVLEVFAGELSRLIEENLSGEDSDAGVLESLSGATGVVSVRGLTVSEDDGNLLAERTLGGSEDVLGLVDGGSHDRSVGGSGADILRDVIAEIIEEFVDVTGERSLGTVRVVGEDGGGTTVEFDETETHTVGVGGSSTGLGAGEGGAPDPLCE